jgi:hypothetical protein
MGKKFERGDFLKKDTKKGSFMIYEGNNISDTSYKKMTVICYYDPESFQMGPIGYEPRPKLEIGTKIHPCTMTLDTEEEDFWIKACTPNEKAAAIEVLKRHGLFWNEETLELVDIESGEVVRRVIIPDNKYYGEIIRPISEKFKELIKKWVISKLRPCYPTHTYDYYDDY